MKYLFIILLFFAVTAPAQVSVQMGAGASSQEFLMADLSLQYRYKPVFIRGGYMASVTRNVDGGVFLNGIVGIHHYFSNAVFIEPGAGYSYILRSNDRKELNEAGFIYSTGIGKDIKDGSLILSANYSKQVFILLISTRYNF